MRYRLNSPEVIQETVDGEALIIHTPSGTYYSLEGTGEHVWNALLAGHTPEEIAKAYADAGLDSRESTAEAVEGFARDLREEQLIVSSDQTTPPGSVVRPTQPFSGPALQKYTDMQELLLVDPIHEVDPQAGWPERRDPV